MTAHVIPRTAIPRAMARARRRHGAVLTWSFAFIVLVVAAATAFVSYVLRPSWPSEPVAIDAPALPITIAGVLFEIPPAAIREGVQRHPGAHERVVWSRVEPRVGVVLDDHAVLAGAVAATEQRRAAR